MRIELDPLDRPGYEAWLEKHTGPTGCDELIFDIDSGLAIKAVYKCPESNRIMEVRNFWKAVRAADPE